MAVDDLDELRAALGYSRLVLNGGSYGTTFFLDYARRHPSSVESLVLIGVAPPHFIIIPLQDAQGAQLSIDRLIAECKSDAECNRNFPSLRTHFEALARRFDKGDISVAAARRDDRTHYRRAPVGGGLYATGCASCSTIPRTQSTHRSLSIGPIAATTCRWPRWSTWSSRAFTTLLAEGLNLSVTCAEDYAVHYRSRYRAHECALVRGRSSRSRAAASLPYLERESRPGGLCRAGAQRRADLNDLRKRRSHKSGEVRSRSAAVSAQRAYLVDSQRFARHRDGVQRPPRRRVRERGQRERA